MQTSDLVGLPLSPTLTPCGRQASLSPLARGEGDGAATPFRLARGEGDGAATPFPLVRGEGGGLLLHTGGDHATSPGHFASREPARRRDLERRAFTVGVGGPVGSGKTALVLALCRALRETLSLAVVTNDIFTREDAEFLVRHQALPAERIRAVETGGCPHAAIREDVSANLAALEALTEAHRPDLLFIESGGDNLAAHFSRELADFTVYVIDVAGGDKIPRKGGPGITQSDLLVINKTDLAPAVGADLGVMERDARRMRGAGPFVFTQITMGIGVEEIAREVVHAWRHARGEAH